MEELDSLSKLAHFHKTDKWGIHSYAPHYEQHFKHLRFERINLLEIGVGGYENPSAGGESLRMWKAFFPNANIFGVDIFDKSPLQEERIKIYQGSQIDEAFLRRVISDIGSVDIIIDDGSHINSHIIQTFKILFPLLSKNGIYAVEDLQTSYWNNHGGDSFNLRSSKTAMNYFKQLADCLNYVELDRPSYRPSYLDQNVVGLSFYHNMAFIQKGENSEKSNWVIDNRLKSSRPNARLKYILRSLRAKFGL